MQSVTKTMAAAALLALLAGCSGDDDTRTQCTEVAECAGQPALPAGQVYACRAQVCTAVAQPYAVYGLQDGGRNVYSLGTWPTLTAGTTPLFDVLAPEDRQLDPARFQVFTGGYLANDGARLVSGYTKPDVTGRVAVYTLQGGSARYVPVPGNLTAAAAAGTFYVSALREPSYSSVPSVYALHDATASVVAEAPAGAGSASGPVAFASTGVAVFGYADKADEYRNHLYALAPTTYAAPGTPVDLTAQTRLELGETFDVAPFGSGVAVLRGVQDKKTFVTTWSDVVRVELPAPASGAAVSPGAPAAVLRFVDACSSVSLEGSMGADLLVRISDDQGKNRHLVRIAQSPGAAATPRTPAADCATANRDPALGTLELQGGFKVVDSAALPDGVGAVTAVPVAP